MDQWQDWGCIYVVRAHGQYKIGRTSGPVWKRLTALQTGSPGKITLVCEMPAPEPQKVERRLHERFASQHTRGEWYALTAKDVKTLKAEAQAARKAYAEWQLQRSVARAANYGWL